MSQRFSRFLAIAMLMVSAGAMLSVSFDAEARRMGGGKSFGRQSSNITQQRQAATPPAAAGTASRAAAPAAGAAAAGAAGAGAKSAASRWLGPIVGIAAGLGIAAMLSHLGLSGAFLEMMSSLLLIGLLVFGLIYIVRRFRGTAASPAVQGAAGSIMNRSRGDTQGHTRTQNTWRESSQAAPAASSAAAPAPAFEPVAAPPDQKWFIPGDFDTPAFLANAKAQFVAIQGVWDSGDMQKITEYLTDDLIAELTPQLKDRDVTTHTEIVLLNAELLGIEAVSGGHLASVRYSGMLREAKDTEAFRFEEVWNLYKTEGAGWLLAGIQQIPLEFAK